MFRSRALSPHRVRPDDGKHLTTSPSGEGGKRLTLTGKKNCHAARFEDPTLTERRLSGPTSEPARPHRPCPEAPSPTSRVDDFAMSESSLEPQVSQFAIRESPAKHVGERSSQLALFLAFIPVPHSFGLVRHSLSLVLAHALGSCDWVQQNRLTLEHPRRSLGRSSGRRIRHERPIRPAHPSV